MYDKLIPYATVLFGGILGCIYGFFFLHAKKGTFTTDQKIGFSRILLLLNPVVRIGFIALLVYLLLLSPLIHSILTIASFLAGFWYIVLFRRH